MKTLLKLFCYTETYSLFYFCPTKLAACPVKPCPWLDIIMTGSQKKLFAGLGKGLKFCPTLNFSGLFSTLLSSILTFFSLFVYSIFKQKQSCKDPVNLVHQSTVQHDFHKHSYFKKLVNIFQHRLRMHLHSLKYLCMSSIIYPK